MENLQRSLNEYLFHEFAVDGDESLISETWPFNLRHLGQAQELTVFEFDDDEPYFALAGRSLDFMPKAGMTFEDLVLQHSGSSWVGTRDPVDLAMSMPGEPSVPSTLERRRALETLGADALSGTQAEIMEGLFLRREGQYLGLFRLPGEHDAVVAGLSSTPIHVSFPQASSWRRLAWGVGVWLQGGAG
jgi:hypothetical protein